jgi:hypothetical protein
VPSPSISLPTAKMARSRAHWSNCAPASSRSSRKFKTRRTSEPTHLLSTSYTCKTSWLTYPQINNITTPPPTHPTRRTNRPIHTLHHHHIQHSNITHPNLTQQPLPNRRLRRRPSEETQHPAPNLQIRPLHRRRRLRLRLRKPHLPLPLPRRPLRLPTRPNRARQRANPPIPLARHCRPRRPARPARREYRAPA